MLTGQSSATCNTTTLNEVCVAPFEPVVSTLFGTGTWNDTRLAVLCRSFIPTTEHFRQSLSSGLYYNHSLSREDISQLTCVFIP